MLLAFNLFYTKQLCLFLETIHLAIKTNPHIQKNLVFLNILRFKFQDKIKKYKHTLFYTHYKTKASPKNQILI